MKNKRKAMLQSSMIMLLIALVSLSTATYAWFTIGTSADVSDISFTTESKSGILISADGTNWKSALTVTDFKITGNRVEGALSPVSTNGAATGKTLNMFTGTVGTDGKLTATKSSESGEYTYYAFDLYVKNEGSTDMPFNLDATSTVTGNGTAGDNGKISYATRVAFLKVGEDATKELADAASADETAALIWEPNATSHSTYAKASRGATDGTVYVTKGIAQAGTYDMSDGAATGDALVEIGTSQNLSAASSGNVAITTLSGNMITKYRVYIFIEGQDIDCNNAESGGTVDVNLKFNATSETE